MNRTPARPLSDLLLHVAMFVLAGLTLLLGLEVLRTRIDTGGIAQVLFTDSPWLPAVVLDNVGWIAGIGVGAVLALALTIDETRRRRRRERRRVHRATRRGGVRLHGRA